MSTPNVNAPGFGKKVSFRQTPLKPNRLSRCTPQALIQTGYRHCTRRTYFLRLHRDSVAAEVPAPFDKTRALRDFLQNGRIDLVHNTPRLLLGQLNSLVADVHSARYLESPGRFMAIDCAFTYSGLKELGLQADLLKVFRAKSKAFYEGAFVRASQHLNDTDASAPTEWADAYQEEAGTELDAKTVDIVLIAHFAASGHDANTIEPDISAIQWFETQLINRLVGCDVPEIAPPNPTPTTPIVAPWVEESVPLDFAGHIYFGFQDGITAPVFSSQGPIKDATGFCTIHALGEILLGYPRNYQDNPFGELPPGVHSVISTAIDALENRHKFNLGFFMGSSFGVLRKMQQREVLFEQWIEAQARKTTAIAADLPDNVRAIKAQLLGRTSDDYPPINAGFRYTNNKTPQDPNGLICPFGSHIRRMNPRDDPVVPFIARPLLRRGMPYHTDQKINGETEKGISGLFLCADITEQFEHLVGHWANGRVLGVDAHPNSRDPLIGNHQPGDGPFSASLPSPETPFVITRGCLYAWFPSKAVLRTLRAYLKH